MKSISNHITYREAVHSDTAVRLGIDNTPTPEQLIKMKILAVMVFEPVRKGLGSKPIYLVSFFRSLKLNKSVKGSKTSQHPKGEAFDIDNDNNPDGPSNQEIFEYIRDNLEFDQLIMENPDDKGNPAWVHVSYKEGHNRKQIMKGINGKYYSL
jgi:zinc D-Ala-D-Ala carboxypeptidase